jgi:electron transport complex protein RnfD
MQLQKTLTIATSPHLHASSSVDRIMLHVVLALLPICAFAIYTFGFAAALVLLTAVVSCVITEHGLCWISGRETTIGDWSAVITGLLLGLVLPPDLPLWMVAVGGLIAIGLGKFLFGGLGFNPFNPALVGRALLQAAFPAAMTHWWRPSSARFESLPASTLAIPMTAPRYDGVSAATPLADWKFNQVMADGGDLFFGSVSGSTGETSALLILLGGVYLAALGVLRWQIPVAIIATVAGCSGVLQAIDPDRFAGPWFMLFSGGLMLGAVFMATDMVASPITQLGCLVYGVLIGLLVVVIRVWSGMPEGVMYAILLGNAASLHIDRWIQPRTYGSQALRGDS